MILKTIFLSAVFFSPRSQAGNVEFDFSRTAREAEPVIAHAIASQKVTIPRQSRGPSYCEPLKAALGALTRPRLIAT
jgi:hypothetical protein